MGTTVCIPARGGAAAVICSAIAMNSVPNVLCGIASRLIIPVTTVSRRLLGCAIEKGLHKVGFAGDGFHLSELFFGAGGKFAFAELAVSESQEIPGFSATRIELQSGQILGDGFIGATE